MGDGFIQLLVIGFFIVISMMDGAARKKRQAAQRLGPIHRCEIEIAALIVRVERRAAVLVELEQEELRLTTRHHRIPQLRGLLHLALQGESRTSGKRRLVSVVDITDQPGNPTTLVVVREDPERFEFGFEEHVALLDPNKPLNR